MTDRLAWQDGVPTEPGYYWLHRPFMEGPYVDYVELFDGQLATVADGLATLLSAQNITRFAGPIPEPER